MVHLMYNKDTLWGKIHRRSLAKGKISVRNAMYPDAGAFPCIQGRNPLDKVGFLWQY